MSLKKKEEVTARRSYEEREKLFSDNRARALEKAMNTERVRYKSNANSNDFVKFLKKRLSLWEDLKTDTIENGRLTKGFTKRHHEKMYNKTKEIVNSLDK
tara:strand:- start:6402 stop:6701 length:300 start_codon:yes stop_codon:yes gene_type:complete